MKKREQVMADEQGKNEHTEVRERTSCRRRVWTLFLIPFLILLITLVVYFIMREERLGEEAQLSELKESAAAFVDQIAVARFWNAQHGGVFAEITAETQPNQYLPKEGRDMAAIDGRRFTKINPAYMTRQLSQIADQRHGYKFRIVGLRPLNAMNAPEPWESNAILSLEQTGAPFVSLVRQEAGASFFNYLVPLRIEQPCLACHQKQGYRTGDVKGAIVVTIPMEKYHAIRTERIKKTVLSLSAIGAAGVFFAVLITLYLSRKLDAEIGKNIERQKKITAMELAGAAAHELRQPLTVIMCMRDILQEKVDRGEAVSGGEMQMLNSQCTRMNEIIERMLHVMNYRTKKYDEETNILDLEACSSGRKG